MKKKVVVVGGGIAGMSASIRLAVAGYDVTIMEKGERLGGKLNVRGGMGYSFDTGPSILTMPWTLEKLFASAGKNLHDYVTITRVEPGWRTFFEDGTKLDLHADLVEMMEEIERVAPKDKNAYLDYLSYANKMYELNKKSFYHQSISGLPDLRQLHSLRELLQMDPLKSMDQATRKYFKSKYLQQLMNFLIMYIGSSPYNAPAVLSQLAHVQVGVGVHYVQGGMYKIAEAMKSLLEELQVKVVLDTKVEQINVNGNRTTGVTINGGEVVPADLVVSNLEAIPAHQTLLTDYPKQQQALSELQDFQPTVSGLVLLLGVNREYPELKHHNFFFAKDQKKEFVQMFDQGKITDDPTVYVGISSKSDSTQAPDGKENLFVLTHVPPLKDGEDWNVYKDSYRELVLNKLERMGVTGLRQHIEWEYQFTPNDIQQLYGSNGGSIYGAVTDRKLNGGFKVPNRSAHVENLYFVGGSTHPGGGVPMVCLSGQLTADLILKDQGKSGKMDDRQIG
ncbi:phytoene desaturase family protein [Mangrovibacillus cuniculi]|uniref:4,4'-diaponeurosporene oxygenase n=1 Tax=Mangrovibacillus cuniculi TaxID=2593652 RepID=A0A7S8HF80_9BACI|nr:phytoene desaturase family protein [Mangrovibacillus cuniculi]QPC46538.1 phytoene desaturase [Mangrovibacillus cuniculi]